MNYMRFTKYFLGMVIWVTTSIASAQQLTGSLETVTTSSVDFNERSFYMLINRSTGLAMDVADRSILNEANIMLATQDIYAMHQVWRMD
jgi:hypothetical protein